MMRVRHQADGERIAAAFALIPGAIRRRLLDVDFLTGVDPVFVGLHPYAVTADGRPYRITAHVAYPCHQVGLTAGRRSTTVVLPVPCSIPAIVHEMGHVLHEQLRFEPVCKPVTRYAETNGREAFAEAFTAWALPFGHGYGPAKDLLFGADRKTLSLFEELAA